VIPVADQFDEIRKRREEIARSEGKPAPEPVQPPADTEQPRMEDYACGFKTWRQKAYEAALAPSYGRSFAQALDDLAADLERERIRHMNEMIRDADWCNRTPGEFTDGA
jgi:hypothetical protein